MQGFAHAADELAWVPPTPPTPLTASWSRASDQPITPSYDRCSATSSPSTSTAGEARRRWPPRNRRMCAGGLDRERLGVDGEKTGQDGVTRGEGGTDWRTDTWISSRDVAPAAWSARRGPEGGAHAYC